MNNNRLKKILAFTLLLIALVAGGWVLWQNLKSDKNPPDSGQKRVVSACEAFSADDAKKIFGEGILQNSLDNNDQPKITPQIEGAPATETQVSTCAYTKGKLELNKSNQQPAVTSEPAPEGTKKTVDPKAIFETQTSTSSPASALPQFSAVVTIRSTTSTNATSDFDKSKPKSAQTVNGLDKPAYWNPKAVGLSGKKQGSLSVLAGDKIIIVSGDSLKVETAQEIVNIILGKL